MRATTPDPRSTAADEWLPLRPVLGVVTRAEWLAVLGAWLLIQCLTVPVFAANVGLQPVGQQSWHAVLVLAGAGYVFWAAMIAPLFALFDGTPLIPGARLRHGVLRVAVAVGVCILANAVIGHLNAIEVSAPAVVGRVGAAAHTAADVAHDLPVFSPGSNTVVDSIAPFVLILLAHAVLQRVHRTQRTIRWGAELRVAAITAQMQALALELQPHFLFNALNGIAELVHDDPSGAERMLLRLGALLRATLATRHAPAIALRRELEQLDLYLDLQRMRFGSRLQITRDVADAAADVLVPNMLLQPLVENALRHGLEPLPGPGRLRVTADHVGDQLRLTVCDSGAGLPVDGGLREGTGLRNTRERLHTLYADAATLVIEPARGGGTQVVVTLPWEPARDVMSRPLLRGSPRE